MIVQQFFIHRHILSFRLGVNRTSILKPASRGGEGNQLGESFTKYSVTSKLALRSRSWKKHIQTRFFLVNADLCTHEQHRLLWTMCRKAVTENRARLFYEWFDYITSKITDSKLATAFIDLIREYLYMLSRQSSPLYRGSVWEEAQQNSGQASSLQTDLRVLPLSPWPGI